MTRAELASRITGRWEYGPDGPYLRAWFGYALITQSLRGDSPEERARIEAYTRRRIVDEILDDQETKAPSDAGEKETK